MPAHPWDNYAALVNGNNVTIQGTGNGANGTTLAAYNRDTTILYIGSGSKGFPQPYPVTNIIITNLTFQGNPTIDYTGSYNTNGIMWADQFASTYSDYPLGSLVVFGGYSRDGNRLSAWSQNLAVQNTMFVNSPSTGLALLWAKDVVVTNCTFTYFDGLGSLASSLGAWEGILAVVPRVEDVAVLNTGFNGNPTLSSSDYGADGLIWLPSGGKFIVQNCAITNHHLEAVSLDSGPYTVVNNTFATKTTNVASCALYTNHNYPTNTLNSINSVYSAYCFVANTVGVVGNPGGGLLGVRDPGATNTYAPYNLMMSANEFKLTQNIPADHAAFMLMDAASEALTVTGNRIDSANHAIYYRPASTNVPNQPCSILALGNDFAKADRTSLYAQDTSNKLTNAVYLANKLGCGYMEHFHLEIAANSPPTNTLPWLTVQGNQFWAWGYAPLGTNEALGGTSYNNWAGWVGCVFTVKDQPLVPTFLGRWVLPGNSLSHQLVLVDSNGNVLTSGGVSAVATVNLNGQAANGYAYAALPTAFVLQPNTTYGIFSQESLWGDSWYYFSGTTNFLNGADSLYAAYATNAAPPLNVTLNPLAGPGETYGPLNFICSEFFPAVGTSWNPTGPAYQINATGQFYINNPSEFADTNFFLY